MFTSLKNAVICFYLAAFFLFFHFSTHIQLFKLIITQFYFGLNDDGGGGGGGDYDNDEDD